MCGSVFVLQSRPKYRVVEASGSERSHASYVGIRNLTTQRVLVVFLGIPK